MYKFLVTIDPRYKKALECLGFILFECKSIEGLYAIETSFEKEYLEQLDFVLKIRETAVGSYDI